MALGTCTPAPPCAHSRAPAAAVPFIAQVHQNPKFPAGSETCAAASATLLMASIAFAQLPPATGSARSCKHGGVEGEAGHAPAGGLRPYRLQAEPPASGTVGLQHVRRGHRDLALRVLEHDEVEPRTQAPADRGLRGPHCTDASVSGREGPEGSPDASGELGGGGDHHEGRAGLEGGRVCVPHDTLGGPHDG
ncbi:NADH dehydrogenase [ubiquinone] 1 alpha subcomplex subunit 13 isoform X2 [Hippopotamus amphibius kiboko]|uniref:NADH dehydrogenase [ubiquinone] 1 alpha subcomplex subunit 13 isoform X2 n=1 Tax=Hippopotamus amphibius kiboko TaxID=575201 RepID=UPI002598DDB6|nr:NADH dehydrogenase [ubiquinone] 1 alpha subcomplex subunit 13 isoform X2 [Hippopotamus amphibius kiboko]